MSQFVNDPNRSWLSGPKPTLASFGSIEGHIILGDTQTRKHVPQSFSQYTLTDLRRVHSDLPPHLVTHLTWIVQVIKQCHEGLQDFNLTLFVRTALWLQFAVPVDQGASPRASLTSSSLFE